MSGRDEDTGAGPERGRGERGSAESAALIRCAFDGDLDGVKQALAKGADVNYADRATGLAALHIAVGTNDLELCRYLIDEAGAAIGPNRRGRWPTLIAAQCHASEALCDYIVAREAQALERKPN